MKYIVVLGDGMADYPVSELGNLTPLQYAYTPTIDEMAKSGVVGMVKTVPTDMPPGSDTANLSVMGYDPHKYYSGRSPFEAASMGVPMRDTDVTFRCNLVTLTEEEIFEERVMVDHSADEISSEEARILIDAVNQHLGTDAIKFYPGFGYRHLMIWDNGPYDWKMVPPHDILEEKIGNYLPIGSQSKRFEEMIKKSTTFLSRHEVNLKRKAQGLRPANSIWIWGEGRKPLLSSFFEKYSLKGTMVSAVDLIKGIGVCAGLESVNIPGATGNIHTNFVGKAHAALDALKSGQDFVYLHVEAPDECGHRHEIQNKVKSIELIDEKIIKVIKEGLDQSGEDYKLMFLPDHPTPLSLRTHTHDPVPFLIYQSNAQKNQPMQTYDEIWGAQTGLYIDEGYRLMDYFILGSIQEGKDK